MTEFVLIHGAWHGGWCWKKVQTFLEERGDVVFAPDLPGHGDDPGSTADATMDNYVDRVLSALNRCERPPVLVGHSMGGAVISQVAERVPEQIERLVFVAAMVPVDGESVLGLAENNHASALRGNLEFSDDGTSVTVADDIIPVAFYHDCHEEDVNQAREKLRPQNVEVLAHPLALTEERYGSVPKQFIECIEDQAIHIASQRWMARRAQCLTNSLNTGHSPFFAAPAALAAFIARIGIEDARA